MYRETNEGLVENVFTLKILNMDDKPHEYRLAASGIEGLQLRLDQRHDDIRVPAGQVNELVVRLRADPYALKKRSTPVTFTIQAEEDKSLKATEPARFLGPIPGSR